jgi:hypothetical protein
MHLLHQLYASTSNSYELFCYSFLNEIHSVCVHVGFIIVFQSVILCMYVMWLTIFLEEKSADGSIIIMQYWVMSKVDMNITRRRRRRPISFFFQDILHYICSCMTRMKNPCLYFLVLQYCIEDQDKNKYWRYSTDYRLQYIEILRLNTVRMCYTYCTVDMLLLYLYVFD